MRIFECLLVIFFKEICFEFFLECFVDALDFIWQFIPQWWTAHNELEAKVCCVVFRTSRFPLALNDLSPSLHIAFPVSSVCEYFGASLRRHLKTSMLEASEASFLPLRTVCNFFIEVLGSPNSMLLQKSRWDISKPIPKPRTSVWAASVVREDLMFLIRWMLKIVILHLYKMCWFKLSWLSK